VPALIFLQRFRHSGVRSDRKEWVLMAGGTALGPFVMFIPHAGTAFSCQQCRRLCRGRGYNCSSAW